MSNQPPPPSRPWLRLTSIARPTAPPPATTPTTAAMPVPPPVGSPPLRPVITLPTFVRPAAPETTVRPPPPALAPLTTPATAPEPQPLPRVLVSQQPGPTPSVMPPSPPPAAEPSGPPSSTVAAPTSANSASVPTTPVLKQVAPSSSLPASPVKKLSPLPVQPRTVAPSSSLPASPAKKPSPRPSPIVSPPKTKLSSPAPAPSSVAALIKPEAETPPRSPVLKPVAPPPPSPLKLPPPQIKAPDEDVAPKIPLEAEQKNVLFQKSVAVRERENGNGDMNRPVAAQRPGLAAATVKEANDAATSTWTGNGIVAKKKGESGEAGVKVIMMAGENKGATMELTHPAKNHRHKIGNKDTGSSSSSDEGKHGREHKGHKGKAPPTASLPTATYTNSNVQGVNNSILYNSSCTHRDPGVHFSLTRKPAEGALPRLKEHKA